MEAKEHGIHFCENEGVFGNFKRCFEWAVNHPLYIYIVSTALISFCGIRKRDLLSDGNLLDS